MKTDTTTSMRHGRKSAPATPPAAPPAATPNTPPADSKGAQDPPDSQEITPDEIKALIGESVTAAIRLELPEHLKGQVTVESIKSLIDEAMTEFKADSTKLTRENLDALVGKVAKRSFEEIRREKKPTGNPGDAQRPQIEIPMSWRKGNLPLHGKQLLNVMMERPANEGIDAADIEKGIDVGEKTVAEYRAHAKMLEFQRHGKALTTTGVGTGDELTPRDLSSELQRRFYLASDLAAVLMAREIDMPTQPYDFPLSTTRPTFKLETVENTNATGSDPGTGNLTLNAKKMMGMVEYSYELDEDSIIPMLPFVQGLLAEAAADAWEDALINGDDSATHQDTDTHAVAKHVAKAFKGFRKLALAVAQLKSDMATGGINEANLRAVRKLLKKYGLNPRNLIFLASPTTALEMQAIANVTTLDKFGPRATILTGELAALFGIPIIGSERVREDVDATGVNGATGNTKSTIICANLSRFLTGRRRDFMVEVERVKRSQTHQLIASFRRAFVPIEVPSATVTSVVAGYNFTP